MKPTDIGQWAESKLITLDATFTGNWSNKKITLALARLEGSIYLRTRKSALEDDSNQLEDCQKSQKMVHLQQIAVVEKDSEEPLNG
ncbi:hypothetical protein INT48_006892 [Thamnidium elegans]|uniref:Uncharacterized protein n=1 Tax=Thamnidium elegans TaxID=101142 RepID=A0A8H7VTA9_9FUNG|nr:hypothetical protein INT48_006892 [Thamnidium elegans]